MKLSSIYGTGPIHRINFREGMNLVLGKVSNPKDLNIDSHNLGKSTLITLIDFLLLAKVDKKHLFKRHEKVFGSDAFFLEIKLNDGRYLTIRRDVAKSSRVSFVTHEESHQDFTALEKWDHAFVAFDNAVTLLNEYLAFDIISQWEYRKSLTYFIRSQHDYRDVFKLDKFSAGKHIYWKPFLFDLLGFDGGLLNDKYSLEDDFAKQKALISGLRVQLSVDPEEIDKIRGAIELKRDDQAELGEEIERFNFYEEERKLNRNLVEELESSISELNSEEYEISMELQNIEVSLGNRMGSGFEEIRKVFEETQVFFGEQLVNGYEQLEDFHQQITEERNKYLNERKSKLENRIQEVRKLLKVSNAQREEVFSVLKDRDALRKFKRYQEQLRGIESDILRLENQLANIDKIGQLDSVLDDISERIEDLSGEIRKAVDSRQNEIYREVRRYFRNIVKYVLDSPALLYLKVNSNGNVDFEADIQKSNEVEVTAEGSGSSYRKMLCIAFDMSVLSVYSKRKFYRFVYHDSPLEGLDNRKKTNYLKKMRETCEEQGLQYIFSSIEDDIPKTADGNFKDVSSQEVVLELHDQGDEGKLFKRSF